MFRTQYKIRIYTEKPKYNNHYSVNETTNKTKLINDPDVRTINKDFSSSTMISMGQDIVENVDDRHEQMGISIQKA